MSVRSTLEAAVERLLYPIIKLLIDCGVTLDHLHHIARRTYVKIASQKIQREVDEQQAGAEAQLVALLEDAGVGRKDVNALLDRVSEIGVRATLRQGLKENDVKQAKIDEAAEKLPSVGRVTSTRIAMMTGVPRKDIPNLLKETVQDVPDDQWYRHRCGRVLADWWRTAEYTDRQGRPIDLYETDASAVDNGEDVSFEKLVRRGGKDLSHHALLDELTATECVEVSDDGRIKVLKRRYERDGLSPESLTEVADQIYSLGETLNARFRGDGKKVKDGFVFTLQADEKKMGVLLRNLKSNATSFLNSAQTTIKLNESKDAKEGPEQRVGVGVYVFMGDEMASSELFATNSSENRKVSNE